VCTVNDRRPNPAAPSVRDVALEAGVSVGTVSRVLNNGAVSSERRARVEQAIATLNYRPNALARSLRTHQSRTLGLVIPDITNPFFGELAHHVEIAAAAAGYWLVVGSAITAQRELEYLEAVVERRVDGLILVPHRRLVDHVSSLGDVPLVVLDREIEGFDVISSDARGGTAACMAYLTKLGHKVIGCVAGPQDVLPARQRYEQYVEMVEPLMRAANVQVSDYVYFGEFDYGSGFEALITLASRSPRPTAVVTSSDQQAIGALRACANLGLRVPADMSIVGFDDVSLAELVDPRLTTVHQDIESMAQRAVQRVLERIGMPSDLRYTPRADVIPTELVIRDSCGPPST
jgi:LacI family transcriptional regulator